MHAKRHSRFKKKARTPSKHDTKTMIVLGLLLVVGLMVLASASSPVGFERFGDSYHFVKGQILHGIIPGLVAMVICMNIPMTWWYASWKVLYGVTLGLLITVFIPGLAAEFGTSASWISFGLFSLQPSEIAKLTTIIALAGFLATQSDQQRATWEKGLLPFVAFVGSMCALIALQPDVGTMMIVALICGSMYMVAGAPWKHIAALMGLGGAAVFTLIMIAPYRVARLLTFINPQADLRGAGYQLNQALIAIGSGGLFGLGLGHSRQKFLYLPEVTSDSIFAVMAEELGFIVVSLFLAILVYFCMRLIKNARQADGLFAKLILTGLAAWIALQSLINIGAIVGIMPLTGVPLPFVSHGGSAMLALLAGCGIALRIAADNRS